MPLAPSFVTQERMAKIRSLQAIRENVGSEDDPTNPWPPNAAMLLEKEKLKRRDDNARYRAVASMLVNGCPPTVLVNYLLTNDKLEYDTKHYEDVAKIIAKHAIGALKDVEVWGSRRTIDEQFVGDVVPENYGIYPANGWPLPPIPEHKRRSNWEGVGMPAPGRMYVKKCGPQLAPSNLMMDPTFFTFDVESTRDHDIAALRLLLEVRTADMAQITAKILAKGGRINAHYPQIELAETPTTMNVFGVRQPDAIKIIPYDFEGF